MDVTSGILIAGFPRKTEIMRTQDGNRGEHSVQERRDMRYLAPDRRRQGDLLYTKMERSKKFPDFAAANASYVRILAVGVSKVIPNKITAGTQHAVDFGSNLPPELVVEHGGENRVLEDQVKVV